MDTLTEANLTDEVERGGVAPSVPPQSLRAPLTEMARLVRARPFEPHPLFTSFIHAALEQSRLV